MSLIKLRKVSPAVRRQLLDVGLQFKNDPELKDAEFIDTGVVLHVGSVRKKKSPDEEIEAGTKLNVGTNLILSSEEDIDYSTLRTHSVLLVSHLPDMQVVAKTIMGPNVITAPSRGRIEFKITLDETVTVDELLGLQMAMLIPLT